MISVITPTYNCANYVRRSYSCLRLQSTEDWEWIVVNDGSTDKTSDIFREICENDSRVKYFSLDVNRGRGFARDFSLKKATGDIIVIWDIDDLYTSDRLSTIKTAIDSGFDFFCSYALLVDNNLNLKGARHFNLSSQIIPGFVHPTLAIRKSLIYDFNLGYNPSMRAGEDLEIMMKLHSSHKGYYCEEYLMIYVEDREVNLSKTISSNRSHLSTIRNIFSKNHDKYSLYTRLKFLFKTYLKIFVLYLLYIKPSLYLKTVRHRDSEHIVSEKISIEILSLLKGDLK